MDDDLILTRDDFTAEFCRKLIAEHGSSNAAAQAVAFRCRSMQRNYPTPVAWPTIKTWIGAGMRMPVGIELAQPADPDRANRIAELLERSNINPDNIGAIRAVRTKAWGYAMKGPDGLPIEGGLHATDITLEPKAPEWPLVDRPAPVTVLYQSPPRILRKTREIVIISDVQYGWLVDPETRVTHPIHDPAALDVAKQITASIGPDELHYIGDFVDWPFLSRWQQHDEFDAPNETVRGAHQELAEFKSAAGRKCKRSVMIGSNHQRRPEQFLLEHNRKAMRLRRATDTSGWPVFSEPYLLAYDELGIEFSGQFPGGTFFLLPDLALMHAPPKRLEMAASVIHGHTHRLSRSTSVAHGYEGRRVYYVYDIGCLCQTGTTLDLQRLMITNTPSDRGRTDFAQGIAVVSVVDGKAPIHSVDQVAIHDGVALYGGQVFQARTLAEVA